MPSPKSASELPKLGLASLQVSKEFHVEPEDSLIQWATNVEATAGDNATHMDLSRAFKDARSNLPEDDPKARIAGFEQMVFDLFLPNEGDFKGRWGPLAPMWSAEDGTCYPPHVKDFPEDAVTHYEAREPVARVPAARARLQDFLWLRRKDHTMARAAIVSYVDAFHAIQGDGADEMLREDYLHRALELAHSLGEVPQDLTELVIRHAEEMLSGGALGWLCQLIRLAAREIATDEMRARNILSGLQTLADAEGAKGGQERYAERSYLEVAAIVAKQLGEADIARTLQEAKARSYEQEAKERADEGAMIESALLQDAVEAYSNAGMSSDLERAKRLLHEASERTIGELKRFSSSYTVPREQIERHVDAMVEAGEKSKHGVFYALALNSSLWPDWTQVAAQTAELKQDAPLQFLARKVQIGPDGQALPRPTEEPAATAFDEAEVYMRQVQIALQFVSSYIHVLRERELWTADELHGAIMENPFLSDAESAIRSGITAFCDSRYWDCVHVLVPQIERALRNVALALGVDVFTYENKTGRVRWRPLDWILGAAPVQQLLNGIRPSLAHELDLLLTDPAGLNLRNDIAHGVLPATSDQYGASLVCVLTLLTLGVIRTGGEDADERK